MTGGGPDWRRAFDGSTLRIQLRSDHEVMVVTPVGVLSVATAPQLRDILLKCVAEGPTAVIVDLDELQVKQPYTLSIFGVVSRSAALWSGVPLLLVAGGPMNTNLHASWLGRFVGIHPTLEAAMAAARRPPIRQLAVWHLPAEPRSAGFARQQLRDSCTAWGRSAAAECAAAVGDELVSNGIRHTHAEDLVLRLELRRNLLTVAVTDPSSAPAVLRAPLDPYAGNHFGLRIVAGLAAAWGSSPTLTGGKTVWAVLRVNAFANQPS